MSGTMSLTAKQHTAPNDFNDTRFAQVDQLCSEVGQLTNEVNLLVHRMVAKFIGEVPRDPGQGERDDAVSDCWLDEKIAKLSKVAALCRDTIDRMGQL